MSVYGEGLYKDADGAIVETAARRKLGGPDWDPLDSQGRPLVPLATPEWKRPNLSSVYALNKFMQEQLTLNLTAAYGMEGVALRLFNVYGPGQALQNPYTGVLAIFASRLVQQPRAADLRGRRSNGAISFTSTTWRRLSASRSNTPRRWARSSTSPAARSERSRKIARDDRQLRWIGLTIAPEITGKARSGDIRHCFADTSKAQRELGFVAKRDFSEGLRELSEWVAGQEAEDRIPQARRELEARGLLA